MKGRTNILYYPPNVRKSLVFFLDVVLLCVRLVCCMTLSGYTVLSLRFQATSRGYCGGIQLEMQHDGTVFSQSK